MAEGVQGFQDEGEDLEGTKGGGGGEKVNYMLSYPTFSFSFVSFLLPSPFVFHFTLLSLLSLQSTESLWGITHYSVGTKGGKCDGGVHLSPL